MTASGRSARAGGDEQPVAPRSAGRSVQDILRAEAEYEDVPAVLLHESSPSIEPAEVPIERYTSAEFHHLEVERMWRKTWQMACRLEDIPDVGDHVVYDIADHSVIVVRAGADDVRGFHNSCLHRGTQLRSAGGNVPALRCPFHGWTWNLDGTLQVLPSPWDFAQVDRAELSLPEVQVDTWGGFVFVNLDPGAPPLHRYLAPLPEHFERWPLARRHKVAQVANVVECNWKVATEAFLEGYHGPTTHPQMTYYAGDENSQYDVYGDHVSRVITAEAVPSPVLRREVAEPEIMRLLASDLGVGDVDVEVPEGVTARSVAARLMRDAMTKSSGVDVSGACTSELIDAIQYFVFPNFAPWGGYATVNYRFRPNGNDPHSCIAEVIVLALFPEGTERPKPPAVHWLDSDDWREAPELGALGNVLNQDSYNLPRVQRGLRAAAGSGRKAGVRFSNYQELRVRHFHRTLGRYVDG